MAQVDLEELIEAYNAAEAAHAEPEALATSGMETPAPSQEAPLSDAEQPTLSQVSTEEDIMFLKEAAHIRKEETPQPAYDYRFLLRPIQEMLAPLKGKGERPAVCVCGHARGKDVSVHLIDRGNGTQRASASGIYRCGNGEACPTCARHVAALRAKRYRLVHEAVNALGGTMLTIIFTIEHDPADRLAPLLAALKSASTGARSDRFWNNKIAPLIHAVGAMTDVHVRRSAQGGWHPHLHVTLPCLTSDLVALRAGSALLIEKFLERLKRLGYRPSLKHQSATILDVRPNAYAAHHHRRAQVTGNLAAEMDEETSLSPFDIAELAAAGDPEMQALFVEFFEAMRGSKSGVITARMAKKLGIEPGTDAGPSFDQATRVGVIPSPVWMKLMDLNLTGTFLTHVETFGREGWQRSRWWALQQTGFVPPVLEQEADEIIHLLAAAHRFEDPAFRQMAEDMIRWHRQEWTRKHGHKTVADTMSYAEAHWSHANVNETRLQSLMGRVMIWADKRIMRRWRMSQHEPALGDHRPYEAVPVG
jgi:hypothetical protein